MPYDKELMTSKLYLDAVFPTMQVLLDDSTKLKETFKDLVACVQFGAMTPEGLLACSLDFDRGRLKVTQGPTDKADLTLTFSSHKKMNALLKGGLALPRIRGKISLLPPFLKLLMGLKVMTRDNARLKTEEERILKVKASLYMITRALSKYNKLGDPDMQAFVRRQPDRIYQFTVEHEGNPHFIDAYLRVKAGKSKSGHGVYTRRTPFVLFLFRSLEGALKVLGKEVEFVEGVEKGYVETIGSPEYACYLNDYMAILQGMLS